MSILHTLTSPLTAPLTSPLTARRGGGVASDPWQTVLSEFSDKEGGAWTFVDAANLYTDSARTTPVTTAGDLIGSVTDESGNGHHASQSGSIRPAWNNGRGEFAVGDYMVTDDIDFSTTDTVTIVAGVYKANDTTITALIEHGLGASGTGRGVRMTGPPYNTGGGFGAVSNGSSLASAQNAPNTPAPVYAVVTGIYRISTDTCVLRVNGQIAEVATADQGSGNYSNAPAYLGAGYGGTDIWSGCNQYRALIIGKELTEDALNAAETACGDLVGVTIGAPKFQMVAIGDSLTYAINAGVTANQAYVKQLDSRLSRVTYSVNIGYSGDTTSKMMKRRKELIRCSTPNIAIIYGGTNDVNTGSTVQASPSPTTTTFSVASGLGASYGADAWITVGGVQRQIESVSTDAITLKTALASAPTAGTAVEHDTEKNLTELANYVKAAGCKRVMILGMHYFNFASGADTVATELPRNAALRVKQQAAATASGSAYVDLYAHMSALITAGTYTQGDNGWHYAPSDQHLNLAGQTILADAIEAEIVAQGWT